VLLHVVHEVLEQLHLLLQGQREVGHGIIVFSVVVVDVVDVAAWGKISNFTLHDSGGLGPKCSDTRLLEKKSVLKNLQHKYCKSKIL
jgi:hypothetical protein